MTTVAAAAAAGAALLRDAGFSPADADIDAGVLARHLLGWSLADWITRRHEPATPAFTEQFARLLHRRSTHEPVAYLTGSREFYGRTFDVKPGVLIPRPETELLVEVALAALPGTPRPRMLDVGSGSGCVAITLALEAPQAAVTSTDVSADALSISRGNAVRLGAAVSFVQADLWPDDKTLWDVIVSNPPYVPDVDRPTLAPDVRDYEPALALFAGADGLDIIRRLITGATSRLTPAGTLCMEVGAGQQEAVTALLESAGFVHITWHQDLQGIPRVVAAAME